MRRLLLLTLIAGAAQAASTGITTQRTLTAAPTQLNLSITSPTEGTSLAHARADHIHGVTGTLAEANGGTGAGALTCTNQFITSNGTLYSCVTATLASAQFANQGTTSSVLIGNAAGNPSWATSVPAAAENVQHNATLSGNGSTGSNLGINLSNTNTWAVTQNFTGVGDSVPGLTGTGGNGTGSGPGGPGLKGIGGVDNNAVSGGGDGVQGVGGSDSANTNAGVGVRGTGGQALVNPESGGTGGTFTAGASFGSGQAGGTGLIGTGSVGLSSTVATTAGGAGGDAINCNPGGGGQGNTSGGGGAAGSCIKLAVATGGTGGTTGTGGHGGDIFSVGTRLGDGGVGGSTSGAGGIGGGLGTLTLGNGGAASANTNNGGKGGSGVWNFGAGGAALTTGTGGGGGSMTFNLGNGGNSPTGTGGAGGGFTILAGNAGTSGGATGAAGGDALIATAGNGTGNGTNGSGLRLGTGTGGTGTTRGWGIEITQNNSIRAHINMNSLSADPSSHTNGDLWVMGTNGDTLKTYQNGVTHSMLSTGTNVTDNATTLIPVGTGSLTFSSTAATTRAGLRNANTRNVVRSASVAAVDCAGGTLNLTVTQLLDGGIATCATVQTINFPTWQGASGIVQALPGAPAIGDVVGPFTFAATAANALTIGLGTGGTNGGANLTVAASATRSWYCRLTNVTGASEAATCY